MKEPITVNLVRKVLEGTLQKRDSVRREEDAQREELRRYSEGEASDETAPFGGLDLEEETDMIERELLHELKKVPES
jgi:hypothetical protein